MTPRRYFFHRSSTSMTVLIEEKRKFPYARPICYTPSAISELLATKHAFFHFSLCSAPLSTFVMPYTVSMKVRSTWLKRTTPINKIARVKPAL